jgi:hypothetical protein
LFVGVQLRFVDIFDIASASAVISTASHSSVFIVGVACDVIVVTLSVILLLVNVVVDVEDTAGASLVQSVPLLVNIFPLVQGATLGIFLESLSDLLVIYLSSSVPVSISVQDHLLRFCVVISQLPNNDVELIVFIVVQLTNMV